MTQIIGEIRDVEEESQQLIREAREEVRQIIEKSKTESKQLLASAEKEAKKQATSWREKALEEARGEAELIDRNTVKKGESLKGAAAKNSPRAVSFIIKKLIS